MKKNLRHKISEFLQSEEGKTTVKAPLALSIMGGSFLLTQVVFTSPVNASGYCASDCDNCYIACTVIGGVESCKGVCVDP